MKRFFIKAKPIRLGRWNKDKWKIKVDHAVIDPKIGRNLLLVVVVNLIKYNNFQKIIFTI